MTDGGPDNHTLALLRQMREENAALRKLVEGFAFQMLEEFDALCAEIDQELDGYSFDVEHALDRIDSALADVTRLKRVLYPTGCGGNRQEREPGSNVICLKGRTKR